MRVAFFVGMIGWGSTWVIATRVVGFHFWQTLGALVASFVSGLLCLISTLAAERNPWIKSHLLKSPLFTWAFLIVTYFGILLALAPQMRDVERLIRLFVPLMAAHGWTIMVFGPVQDWIIKRGDSRWNIT